jgi:hypothetical protein
MNVSGVGASTCAAKYGEFAFSRLTEVANTTVQQGHRPALPDRRPDLGSGGFLSAPLEAGAVGPNAVQDRLTRTPAYRIPL